MSRYFTIPLLVSVVALSADLVNRSSAHEGHEKPSSRKPYFDSGRVHAESRSGAYETERSAPGGAQQAAPDCRHGHRELDLRNLAIRLEFAAEIVSEEIHFDMPPTPHVEHLFVASHDVETKAYHFRESLEQGADDDHLHKGFHVASDAFATLGRALQHYHRSFLVDQAMSRTDRIIGTITRVLDNRHAAPKFQGLPMPRSLPGETTRTLRPQQPPSPLLIPEEMTGISLLPREQQAAAMTQKTCPVTGDLLGSLGKQLTVRIGDRTIFVCCEDCVEETKVDPKKHLSDNP